MSSKSNDKIRLFALIEPLNLKMSLCFPADTLVAEIHYFIDDIMKKYNVKYKVGRIDWNGAWILPQYRIGDFFEDKTEITIYSIEYGLTLTSLSSERERLHVNYSVFNNQELNTNFLKKKLSRLDKKKKHLASNMSRTTEVNDVRDLDPMPEQGLRTENNNDDTNVKNNSTSNTSNVNNGHNNTQTQPQNANIVREKQSQSKNPKQKFDGNKAERQDNQNKNKGKNESNTKQNLNQQKNKQHHQHQQQQHQQHIKQNNANDSSADESKKCLLNLLDDEEDFRNEDRTNRNAYVKNNEEAKHRQSEDSDTDSVDPHDDLKFLKRPTPINTSKNR